MFLRDRAGLKMSLYCEDPTSVSTASAYLISYGNRHTSYEVRVTPILPIQKKGNYALQKILEMSSILGVWQDEDY